MRIGAHASTPSYAVAHTLSAAWKYLWRTKYEVLVAAVFCGAFIVRIWNLGYNAPFSDEAIYVVIGRLGIFQHDWYSYNASAWMAGLPYIYPPLTAIAYETFGIIGSRFLNVIFGMLLLKEVYVLTQLFSPVRERMFMRIAAITAVYITGFSAVAIFVSQLATYDALSFWLLLFGTNQLLVAHVREDGKGYFLGALALVVSFYTKIIAGAFIPPLFLLTWWYARRHGTLLLWRRYFVYPLLLGFGFYFTINFHGFLVYAQAQSIREYGTFTRLMEVIWYDASWILLGGAVSLAIVLLHPKRMGTLFLLWLAATLPLIHFIVHRYSTLEKHTVLTILFLSPIIGYAVSYLITHSKQFIRISATVFILAILALYPNTQSPKLGIFEHAWQDSDLAVKALAQYAHPGDKVLTEIGPNAVLGLYGIVRPTDVTTFDWLEYQNQTGDPAYIAALHDGYFNLIELDNSIYGREAFTSELVAQLGTKYRLVYDNTPFQIYERTY